MNIISLKNISKVYNEGSNEFRALKNVSLEIKEGESIAIIGKSGSGKSTLMHIMALLDTPTDGHISIDGEESTKLRRKQLDKMRNKTFGFVFQQFFMNAKDTVLDNVMVPLKIARVKYSDRKKIAMNALEQVDLTNKAESRANDLSGGQKHDHIHT